MHYVTVDLEGASRDYFDTRESLLDALRQIEVETPGATVELYVVTYDDAGVPQGEPERADEALAETNEILFLSLAPAGRVPIPILTGPRHWARMVSATQGSPGDFRVSKNGITVTWRDGRADTDVNETDARVPPAKTFV